MVQNLRKDAFSNKLFQYHQKQAKRFWQDYFKTVILLKNNCFALNSFAFLFGKSDVTQMFEYNSLRQSQMLTG